jgi:hypothetical protein
LPNQIRHPQLPSSTRSGKRLSSHHFAELRGSRIGIAEGHQHEGFHGVTFCVERGASEKARPDGAILPFGPQSANRG